MPNNCSMKPLSFLLLLVLAASCRREANTQPQPTPAPSPTPTPTPQPIVQPISTWVIGTDSFASNRVTMVKDKAGIALNIGDAKSKFYYHSIIAGMPDEGTYPFNLTGTNDPNYFDISFARDTQYLVSLDSGYVYVLKNKDTTTFQMSARRFMNYYDSSDVRLITATIKIKS